MELKPREELKTKKVMMLWTESLHLQATKIAKAHNISVSELSRVALNKLIKDLQE